MSQPNISNRDIHVDISFHLLVSLVLLPEKLLHMFSKTMLASLVFAERIISKFFSLMTYGISHNKISTKKRNAARYGWHQGFYIFSEEQDDWHVTHNILHVKQLQKSSESTLVKTKTKLKYITIISNNVTFDLKVIK